MKLSEKLTSNLFDLMGQELPCKQYITNDQLQIIYLLKYGQSQVLDEVESISLEMIAPAIYSINIDRWTKIFNRITSEILKNGNLTETYTRNETDNSTNSTSRDETTTNTVSAYNVEDFSNNDKSVVAGSDKATSEGEKTTTYTRNRTSGDIVNNYSNYFNLLQKHNFFDIIFLDINALMCKRVVTLN